MASVTGLTAAKMLELAGENVVAGFVDIDGHLLLTRRDSTSFDAGLVRGADGSDATVPDASTTVKGKLEIAEESETDAGTSNVVAVSPLSMAKLTIGLSIAGGTDLDALFLTGQYHQATAANATIALHYPLEGVGGLLVVEVGTNFIQQTYITRPSSSVSRMFSRAKYSSNAWSTWAELTDVSSRPVKTVLSAVTTLNIDDLIDFDEYHFVFDVRGDSSSAQMYARPRLNGVNETALVEDYAGGYGTSGSASAYANYDVVEVPLVPGSRLDINLELGVFRLNEAIRTMVKSRFFEINTTDSGVSGTTDARFASATAYNGIYFRFTNAVSGFVTLRKVKYT